jgi:hypothetical protein
MQEKTKRILLQIFATKIGWLAVCSLLIVIFGVLSKYYPWANIFMMISSIYPIVMCFLLLLYGLIINPIKKLMNKD